MYQIHLKETFRVLFKDNQLPIYALRPTQGTLANSVHPDQTPQNQVYTVCIKYMDFYKNVIIKCNQASLLLGMDLSIALRLKNAFG